jgi:UDP-glucose 4-epimerase
LCADIEEILPEHLDGIDVVYHVAAAAYEGVSNFSPAFIGRNIYAGSARVFSAAIAAGVKRIVFTSTMARYGHPLGKRPFVETDDPIPVDPYGIAKLAAERLLINLCETHGAERAIAVPHNIYGRYQKYNDPYRNVCAIFANRMLQGQPPIIYGDGSQMRCFSFVSDVVPSLARMGFDPAASGEIINIGPDEGAVDILTLAQMLAEITGCNCDPIFVPARPREVKHAVCSSDKARRLLGFEQKVELYEGLCELVEWIRRRGPKPFDYHLEMEIRSDITPETWAQKKI